MVYFSKNNIIIYISFVWLNRFLCMLPIKCHISGCRFNPLIFVSSYTLVFTVTLPLGYKDYQESILVNIQGANYM